MGSLDKTAFTSAFIIHFFSSFDAEPGQPDYGGTGGVPCVRIPRLRCGALVQFFKPRLDAHCRLKQNCVFFESAILPFNVPAAVVITGIENCHGQSRKYHSGLPSSQER